MAPEPLTATAATCLPHHACVCRAEPSHCLYPALHHAVPSSQPNPTPFLSNGHCLDGEAPPLNQGGKSRRVKSGHGGGTSVSQSKLYSSSWHVPHNEPDDLTRLPAPAPIPDGSQGGVRSDPGRLCLVYLESLFSQKAWFPSCAELAAGWPSWMPEMARGRAGKAPRAGPRSLRSLRLPQLVTASLSREPSRCSTPRAYNQPSPQKGKHAPSEMVLPPVSAGSNAVLSSWSS